MQANLELTISTNPILLERPSSGFIHAFRWIIYTYTLLAGKIKFAFSGITPCFQCVFKNEKQQKYKLGTV